MGWEAGRKGFQSLRKKWGDPGMKWGGEGEGQRGRGYSLGPEGGASVSQSVREKFLFRSSRCTPRLASSEQTELKAG